MSDIPKDAQRGRLGFILMLILVALGSVLILFPAFLPTSSFNTVGEDGAVELLQLAFLILSAALYFATASHAGRLRPIFIALGLGGICAAIGEYRNILESLIPIKAEWLQYPLFAIIAYLFTRYIKPFGRFWGLASRQPTSGFLVAGVILAYVFGEAFGSKDFWEASLGVGYDKRIPSIVQAYLELLACYFIFVATIGFCLPITKRAKTSLDPEEELWKS